MGRFDNNVVYYLQEPLNSLKDSVNYSGLDEVAVVENGDGHFIEISVSEPQKIGDGMNSYIAYK